MTENTPGRRDPDPDALRYIARLDEAVADLVDIVREHIPQCLIPGVCVGEAADVVSGVPHRALVDMVCQFAIREATYRGRTPPYVHRLLDALISGDALDFERAYVPADVADRIVVAVQEGRVRVRPGDPE